MIPNRIVSAVSTHRTRVGVSSDIRNEFGLAIASGVMALILAATSGFVWPPPGFFWILLAGALGSVVRGTRRLRARSWLDEAQAWPELEAYPLTPWETWIVRVNASRWLPVLLTLVIALIPLVILLILASQ
jgi:hypothetical protein